WHHHSAGNANALDKPGRTHQPGSEQGNSRISVGSERRSGGEIRHDCSDPATVIYQSRLRDVIASLRQPTQSKHVVVTKDVRVGSVCHQRPECSTTTESPGDIVDVAAGD